MQGSGRLTITITDKSGNIIATKTTDAGSIILVADDAVRRLLEEILITLQDIRSAQ